jgi:small subunit ribosomal protein S9
MADTKTIKKGAGIYTEAVGRRKTSVARVRLEPAAKLGVTVNDKPFESYFTFPLDRQTIMLPFEKSGTEPKFKISVKVNGGGAKSQAVAVQHGISRVLIALDSGLRSSLKKEGFLKRDPRMKERRKFGLKKARKAAQWAKR